MHTKTYIQNKTLKRATALRLCYTSGTRGWSNIILGGTRSFPWDFQKGFHSMLNRAWERRQTEIEALGQEFPNLFKPVMYCGGCNKIVAAWSPANHKKVATIYLQSHREYPCAVVAFVSKTTFLKTCISNQIFSVHSETLPVNSPIWFCPFSKNTCWPPGKALACAMIPMYITLGSSGLKEWLWELIMKEFLLLKY